jgi:hypothetical protein
MLRLLCLLALFTPAHAGDVARLRELLARRSGSVALPAGVFELDAPLELPAGVNGLAIRGAPGGTSLKAAAGFQGAALLIARGAANLRISGLRLDGNRAAFSEPHELPPSNRSFAEWTPRNGLLILRSRGVTLRGIEAVEMAGYAVLVSRSGDVLISALRVARSGSRNARGRNNATGGILIEDGSSRFRVLDSEFRQVLGNALWTHSRQEAPRNLDGLFRGNRFFEIGRDALQVGHATRVRVEANMGERIGFPFEAVDGGAETAAIPVAIDTAGNVDHSAYTGNRFREINGKCIDLDGFHHGTVSRNDCRNAGGAAAYPDGSYAIVFNNNNPGMRSERVLVTRNHVEGFKFGAVFLLGSAHRVADNRFLDINRAGCPESHARFGCLYFPGQPDLLSAGIYLGVSAATWSRAEPATANVITGNEITGYGMDRRCVAAAPQVQLESNTLAGNRCSGAPPRRP